MKTLSQANFFLIALGFSLSCAQAQIADLHAETTRATAAENALGIRIAAETTRAAAAENALGSRIADETTRATIAEGVLTTGLATEKARAIGIEDLLGGRIFGEKDRATGAEGVLGSRIADETTRATIAEGALGGRITGENARATGAEGVLTTGLATEKARAIGIENGHNIRLISAEANIQRLNRGIAMPAAGYAGDTGFLYSSNGSTITITGIYPKASGDLVIPSTINNLPVTSIGSSAFYGSYELTSITLPSSVTSIGDGAFYGCSGLTSITIPSGVTFIGSESFMWCDGLTGVYFLGNAPAKGYGVFGGVLGATVYYVNGKAGWGATFAGRSTAKWIPVEPPVPTVNTLVVQVSPFFQNPSWTSVVTNRFPNNGLKQFYRMRASVVEVAPDLKNPAWTPVATNNLPSSGYQQFYRLVAR